MTKISNASCLSEILVRSRDHIYNLVLVDENLLRASTTLASIVETRRLRCHRTLHTAEFDISASLSNFSLSTLPMTRKHDDVDRVYLIQWPLTFSTDYALSTQPS